MGGLAEGRAMISSSLMLVKRVLLWLVGQGLRLFPVKRTRVVFISHGRGSQYADSPRCIAERLSERYGDKLEIVWVFDDPGRFLHLRGKGYKLVRFHSPEELFYSSTANVYVGNLFGPPEGYVVKRKGRMILETSHGVPYKLLHYKPLSKGGSLLPQEKLYWRMRINQCDICISDSDILAEHGYRWNLGYNGKILSCGLPRNDVFFSQNDFRESVRAEFGLEPRTRIALIAPTWRDGDPGYVPDIDYSELVRTLELITGGRWVVMLRLHHRSEGDLVGLLESQRELLFDATGHPDVQELLCASDLLITDYSSISWDFAIQGKPVIIYAPDIEEYTKGQRFNVPPAEWALRVVYSSEELLNLFRDTSLEELGSISRIHTRKFGCCDTGDATETVCNLIAEHCGVGIGRER